MTHSILIAEDEILISSLVEEVLSSAGYRVAVVGNADHAIDQLREQSFGALIADIRMPGSMDGWQLAHEARSIQPLIRVIYMTGDSMLSWSAQKVTGGLIFQKPVTLCSLLAALHRLLETEMLPADHTESAGRPQYSTPLV